MSAALGVPFIVFLIAFVVRLIFIWQWAELDYALVPLLDAKAYDLWAREIAGGKWIRDTAFYQSPLYPYVLALIYKLFGTDLQLVGIIQSFLGSLTCALLAIVGLQIGGVIAGLVSGFLAAFYTQMIFYSAPLLKETLLLFLLTLFLFVSVRAIRTGKISSFVLSGVALGFTALTRSNALLLGLAVIVATWAVRRSGAWQSNPKRSVARPLLAFTVAVILSLLPATLHNLSASRDLVGLNYNGGFNFYIGHSNFATGANSYPPGISTDPEDEEEDTVALAERAIGASLSPSAVSRYWFKQGLQFLLENPGRELQLFGRKILLVLNHQELPDNYDIDFVAREFNSILEWPLIPFWLVLLLAILGFTLTPKHFESRLLAGFAGIYALSVVLFYVTDRYRLPMVIFLFPLAGVGVAHLWRMARPKSWRQIGMASGVSALSTIVIFLPSPLPRDLKHSDAYNWGVVAAIDFDSGRAQESVDAIEDAVVIDPTGPSAEALIKGAYAYSQLKRPEDAERLLKLAVKHHPDDGFTFYNLGKFKYETGAWSEALQLFQKSAEVMPWRHLPFLGMALSYLKLGERAKGLASVHEGLKRDPHSPELLQLLQIAQ